MPVLCVGAQGFGLVSVCSDADVFIYVDVGRAMADGIAFYRADNGVILTKGEGDTGILPTRYFERVEKRNAAGAWEHLDVW